MASCTSMPYHTSMIFIEAPIFSKLIYDYLDENEYAALQWSLSAKPDHGEIIPGSGGLRKIRWALKGRGKRGGVRVIYYWQRTDGEIWLLTMYAKNEAENIPAHILKKIKEAMES